MGIGKSVQLGNLCTYYFGSEFENANQGDGDAVLIKLFFAQHP